MFCESDYFENGRAVTISETVFDGRSVDTGMTMTYVNCAYRGNDEIGRLIHDMMCSNPENIYDKDIREKVRKVKEGKEIRRMCEVLDTAVHKAVARERQRLNIQKNKLIAEKDNVIEQQKYVIRNKDSEIERLRKENEMLRIRIESVSEQDS